MLILSQITMGHSSLGCCSEFLYPFDILLETRNYYCKQTLHYKLVPKWYFSDLGCGWHPAVLDSIEELDSIIEAVNGSNDNTGYWIGGSTDDSHGSTVSYSEYYTDGSGNNYIYLFMLKIQKETIPFFFQIHIMYGTLMDTTENNGYLSCSRPLVVWKSH